MTHPVPKATSYPRSHLLAASGIAALLSLALLVFPSREVEAKKTYLSLELDNGSEQIVQEKDDLRPDQAGASGTSPFADNNNSVQADANNKKEEKQLTQPTDPLQKSVTVANGDTLSTVFSRVGLDANALHEAIGSSKDAKRFSRLHVGQVLDFKLTPEGQLERMSSKLNDLESISLTRSDKGFSFKRELVKPDVRTSYAHGVINSSLFLSAKRAGLSHSLTMDLANVFGYDIDFAQDIRQGDEFELIYEEHVVNNKQVGNGNILSARFTNRGKTYTAVRYTSKQGVTSYYNADGMSMRKAFIRTPVDFARISSKFSMGRRHPILNKIRAQGRRLRCPARHADQGRRRRARAAGRTQGRLRQCRGHPARQQLPHPVRAHARLRQGRAHRQYRQAGADHRLYRHHRPVDRTAPALRVPGQWPSCRSAQPETADGRPHRSQREAALPAAE